MTEHFEDVSLDSDWECVEPQSFPFFKKRPSEVEENQGEMGGEELTPRGHAPVFVRCARKANDASVVEPIKNDKFYNWSSSTKVVRIVLPARTFFQKKLYIGDRESVFDKPGKSCSVCQHRSDSRIGRQGFSPTASIVFVLLLFAGDVLQWCTRAASILVLFPMTSPSRTPFGRGDDGMRAVERFDETWMRTMLV